MKESKYYKKKMRRNKCYSNDKSWISKLMLSIIIVLLCLIVTNFDNDLRTKFKSEVLDSNINFSYFNKLYKKYIGGNNLEDDMVVANVVEDTLYEEVDGSYKFTSSTDEGVEVKVSGIIVYVGDKDNLGNTVIVQGNDGVDIWYSNIELLGYSLYDYVSSGEILGNSSTDKYILTIVKDGEKLKYEEYFK